MLSSLIRRPRKIWRRICRRWPGPSAGPGGGAASLSTDLAAAKLPPKRVDSRKFASIKTRSRRNSTTWVWGESRFSPSREPTSIAWLTQLQLRQPVLEFTEPILRSEGSAIAKRVREQFERPHQPALPRLRSDANQNNVDNGAIINAVALDPTTLTAPESPPPEAYFQNCAAPHPGGCRAWIIS